MLDVLDVRDIEFPNFLEPIRLGQDIPKMVPGDNVLIMDSSKIGYVILTKLRSGKHLIVWDEPEEEQLAKFVRANYNLEGYVQKREVLSASVIEAMTFGDSKMSVQ